MLHGLSCSARSGRYFSCARNYSKFHLAMERPSRCETPEKLSRVVKACLVMNQSRWLKSVATSVNDSLHSQIFGTPSGSMKSRIILEIDTSTILQSQILRFKFSRGGWNLSKVLQGRFVATSTCGSPPNPSGQIESWLKCIPGGRQTKSTANVISPWRAKIGPSPSWIDGIGRLATSPSR